MASSLHFLLLSCSLLNLIFSSSSSSSSSTAQKTSFRPKALLLPVTKDATTRQYTTHIAQRTPQVPIKLTIDLGGELLWVDCERGFNSSTYNPVPCRSAQCNLSGTKACTSTPNPADQICVESPTNTVINLGTSGHFSQDIFSLHSTHGSNPGRLVSLPKFLFTCAPTFLLKGLATGVKGMAGFGRTKISTPLQFSAAFSIPRKFALCLSSSTSSKGVIFLGDGPYNLLPGVDVSRSLTYTPLIQNPVNLIGGFSGEHSAEYFIGVKAIKINGRAVALNSTLLAIDGNDGHGGTKISTVDPYTVMETSIYNAVVEAFVKAMGGVPRVAAVAPFGACFSSKNIGRTRTGPAVPPIDLVLQKGDVLWRIFGANSMVEVGKDVLCLGFVDGGRLGFVDWGVKFTRTSIVIGGHQIEDNLVQIDLAASRLGFSSSLLFKQTTCSNFNFTSVAY